MHQTKEFKFFASDEKDKNGAGQPASVAMLVPYQTVVIKKELKLLIYRSVYVLNLT